MMVVTAFAFLAIIIGIIGCIIFIIGLTLFIIIKIKKKRKSFLIVPIILLAIGLLLVTPSVLLVNTIIQGNKADEKKYGSLYYNTEHNNKDKVKKLLESGVDPDTNSNTGGVTPLMEASKNGNLDIVKLLLENGADVNTVANKMYNTTALLEAVDHNGPECLEIVKLFIKSGVDVNARNSELETPLIKACEHANARGFGVNIPSMAKLLIDNGANVNECDSTGETALMKACGASTNTGGSFGSFDHAVVKVLIDSGASTQVKNKARLNALDCIKKRHEEDKNWMDYKKWATVEYENNYNKTVEILKTVEIK